MARTVPRVAVVAVHGVADQQSGESAAAMAALLSRLRQEAGGPAAYAAFVAEDATISTDCVEPAPLQPQFQEDAADREAREQLDGYEHDDAPYCTRLLRGRRLDAKRATHDVTVMEMYWADLSRLRGGMVRILSEAYQLIFQLPALGIEAIANARSAIHPDAKVARGALRASIALHAFAATLVTLIIPMLNLGMIVALAASFPSAVPPDALADVSYARAGVFWVACAGAVSVLWLVTARSMRGWTVWATGSGALGLVVMLVAVVVKCRVQLDRIEPLSIVSSVLAAGALYPIVSGHARRTHPVWVRIGKPEPRADDRRGRTKDVTKYVKPEAGPRVRKKAAPIDIAQACVVAFPALAGVALALVPGVVENVHGLRSPPSLTGWMTLVRAAMHGAEWCLAVLLTTWCVALAVTVLAVVSGFVAYVVARDARPAEEKVPVDGEQDAAAKTAADEARQKVHRSALWRALATGRLALLASIALFLVVTLAIGAAVEISADKTLHLPDVQYDAHVAWFRPPTADTRADAVLDAMLASSGTPVSWLIGILFVLALASVAIPLLPNALAEISPPNAANDNPIYGIEFARIGVKVAEWCLILALAALLVGALMGVGLFWSGPTVWVNGVLANATTPLTIMGTLLVGTATGLFAFRGKLSSLALGFRPAIDVALDVANYFRQRPASKRLRAAASARFASVLEFLVAEDYDAIIVVAHSQGSVIAADLLRYLHRAGRDREFGVDRIVLFTMGCPLRQLYAARFPVRYAWAEQPDPTDLGVKKWLNAFRRGDYVGQFLWDAKLGAAKPASVAPFVRDTSDHDGDARGRDICLGDGAHTHYWDGNGAVIARELDVLVGKATVRPQPAPGDSRPTDVAAPPPS